MERSRGGLAYNSVGADIWRPLISMAHFAFCEIVTLGTWLFLAPERDQGVSFVSLRCFTLVQHCISLQQAGYTQVKCQQQ